MKQARWIGTTLAVILLTSCAQSVPELAESDTTPRGFTPSQGGAARWSFQQLDRKADFRRLRWVTQQVRAGNPDYVPAWEKSREAAEVQIRKLMARQVGVRSTSWIQQGDRKVEVTDEFPLGSTVTRRLAYSVMDKDRVGPSGSKHDFYSAVTYTSDGHFDVEGNRGTDKRAIRDMTEALTTIAPAYAISGQRRYSWFAAHVARTWFLDPQTRMNPNLKHSQWTDPQTPNTQGVISMHHLPRILDALSLLEGTDSAWTADDRRRMVQWCISYRTWLKTSTNGRAWLAQHEPNNIGTWYWAQRIAIADYIGDRKELGAIVEEVRRRLLAHQIEPDGRQLHELRRTRSFTYSVFNIRALMAIFIIAHDYGHRLWEAQAPGRGNLTDAIEYAFTYISNPSGWTHEQLHPDALEDALHIAPVLMRANRSLDRELRPHLDQLLPAARVGHEATLWYRK